MARTVRDAKLETRTARAALKPSGKPYFRAIDEGLHLGYRKGQAAGKWVVRSYAGEQSYTLETIGTADDTIDPDGMTILSFAQAQAIARQRFIEGKRLAAGQPPVGWAYTVQGCNSRLPRLDGTESKVRSGHALASRCADPTSPGRHGLQ